jgi:hypothetical protein
MPNDGDGLDRAELSNPGGAEIPKDRCTRHTRRDLFEKFQPFPAHAVLESGKASGIASWLRQASHQPRPDRVRDRGKYDRHGMGSLTHRFYRRAARGKDDVWCERDQLLGVPSIEVGIARAPARVDPQVAPYGPACFLQTLKECCEAGLPFGVVCPEIYEHPDASHSPSLLRPRHYRPRSRRTAEQRDELATSH